MSARRRGAREVRVFRRGDTGRWVVAIGTRPISVHRLQRTAIVAAIRAGKQRRTDVLTHGCNGRIRSKDSYGNESPVRDTEH